MFLKVLSQVYYTCNQMEEKQLRCISLSLWYGKSDNQVKLLLAILAKNNNH